MRRFITSAALAISLLGTAGFADARGFGNGREVGHGPVVRSGGPIRGGEVRGEYRERSFRPERRVERFEVRAGFNWHAGDWSWNGSEWIWVPGYYVRVAC